MKQLLNIILASFIFNASAAVAAEIQISCNVRSSISNSEDQRIYILNLEKLSVGDVETEPTHKGELQISDNFYQLDFPETTTRVAHMAKINRYTGKLNGEAGSPPFGKSKDGNWHRTGLCKKVENKKLF